MNNLQSDDCWIFKSKLDLDIHLGQEDFKLMIDEPFCASYRVLQPHIDRNGGYTFRFFKYVGRDLQPAHFMLEEREYVIESGTWVLFNCQKTHSCASTDWMTFEIYGCEYRYRLESFSHSV